VNEFLHNLTELLRELPGIGPRQARRLAFWFVRKDVRWVERFSATLLKARTTVRTCSLCMRLFEARGRKAACPLCADSVRDTKTLLVVEKDVDLENIERTSTYKGNYFVLGGTASMLDKVPDRYIRMDDLLMRLRSDGSIQEVIFAFSATTEGEDTATYVRECIEKAQLGRTLRVTELGRGLSTGTELEYVDAATMQDALRGRH